MIAREKKKKNQQGMFVFKFVWNVSRQRNDCKSLTTKQMNAVERQPATKLSSKPSVPHDGRVAVGRG